MTNNHHAMGPGPEADPDTSFYQPTGYRDADLEMAALERAAARAAALRRRGICDHRWIHSAWGWNREHPTDLVPAGMARCLRCGQNVKDPIDTYFIDKGQHDAREDGMCAMEWTAYLAGEPHSDRPKCVSPVLTEFCVVLNDQLRDNERQRLRPYIARMIGTRDDGRDDERQMMAADWIAHTWAPTWLELAGLDEAAQRLRSLAHPVTSLESAVDALQAVEREAITAKKAMVTATNTKDAVRAMGETGWDAAWNAAWSAALDITWTAMEAWSAAWNVPLDTAWTANTESGAAVKSVLEPTVKQLQNSAFDLLDRMLPAEPIQKPVAPDADRFFSA